MYVYIYMCVCVCRFMCRFLFRYMWLILCFHLTLSLLWPSEIQNCNLSQKGDFGLNRMTEINTLNELDQIGEDSKFWG